MRSRGQAIVEFALIAPVMLFTMLGFLEAAFLVTTQATQIRATEVVADYAAAHPGDESWHAVATQVGLGPCEVTVEVAPHDIVHVGAICHYTPRVTNGLGWSGLPISTEADAATEPMPSPTPSVDPSPSPS